MPHASDPERFKRIAKQMKSVKLVTFSEYEEGKAKPIDDIELPTVGETNAEVFENNLLDVMQFVFDHTTFDRENEMAQAVLAAYKPLGIEAGKPYDETQVAQIDGKRFCGGGRANSAQVAINMTALDDLRPRRFQPKGETRSGGGRLGYRPDRLATGGGRLSALGCESRPDGIFEKVRSKNLAILRVH